MGHSKFADTTELKVKDDKPEDHTAFQKDLSMLERWPERNLRASSRRSAKSCSWGGAAPCTSISGGPPAGKQLGRKGPGGPGGHGVRDEPATSPCCEESVWFLPDSDKVLPVGWGLTIPSYTALLRPHLLCPVLGFPVPETLWHSGEGPVKGREDNEEGNEGMGTSVPWGKAYSCLAWRREGAVGSLTKVFQYLKGWCKEEKDSSASA